MQFTRNLLAVSIIAMLSATACGAAATPEPTATPPPTATPEPTPTLTLEQRGVLPEGFEVTEMHTSPAEIYDNEDLLEGAVEGLQVRSESPTHGSWGFTVMVYDTEDRTQERYDQSVDLWTAFFGLLVEDTLPGGRDYLHGAMEFTKDNTWFDLAIVRVCRALVTASYNSLPGFDPAAVNDLTPALRESFDQTAENFAYTCD